MYQRTMMAIFHNMFHKNMEFYMDDLVVNSVKEDKHLIDLWKVFQIYRRFQLKMNPFKCAFGMTWGKFLGFIVNQHRVQVDKEKKKGILAMEIPKSQ